MAPSLVGVIDEGTSSCSFSVFTTPDFVEIASHTIEVSMMTPQEGWYEQDPYEIMQAVNTCCEMSISQLREKGHSVEDIATIGITNQRETIVLWDEDTGEPLCKAILWKDLRCEELVNKMVNNLPGKNKDYYKKNTGLPLSPFFSGPKIRWLRENNADVKDAFHENRCKIGTVDSWIIWNLTGGEAHVTDVTNASRTMLMNIHTLRWDPQMLKLFKVQQDMLPEIRSCSEIYGRVTKANSVLKGKAISGIMANQQAALYGHQCVKPGQVKNTYRSGCFMLCNTGDKCVESQQDLLTTVAFKLGPDATTYYALEGAVPMGGQVLDWLQNQARLIPSASMAEAHAAAVPTTGDVYFVPAMSGRYMPYWRKDARGIICGLTQFTTKNHIVRATLESICFQTRDILECMNAECGAPVTKLRVDGHVAANNLLMQLQADIIGIPVHRTKLHDMTAVGAARCAAQARGILLWYHLQGPGENFEDTYQVFKPQTTETERDVRYNKWSKALNRSLGWTFRKQSVDTHNAGPMAGGSYPRQLSLSAGIFLCTTLVMIAASTLRK